MEISAREKYLKDWVNKVRPGDSKTASEEAEKLEQGFLERVQADENKDLGESGPSVRLSASGEFRGYGKPVNCTIEQGGPSKETSFVSLWNKASRGIVFKCIKDKHIIRG